MRSPAVRRPEMLERRMLMSAVAPTDWEQYMLELVNRARANPAAEAARHGIDLNEGLAPGTLSTAARQPLALNPFIIDAARKHSQWMIDDDVFSHTGAGGSNPGGRMAIAGYGAADTFGWGENIAYRGQKPSTPPPTATTAQEHADLFVDEGIDGRGHRLNILAPDFKEVGIGIATGVYNTYNALISTQDFGYKSGNSFLTGVAFDDGVTGDDFYTPGEGLDGVTITAAAAGGQTYSTTTWSTGGYALQLPPGTYTVTASGGELAAPVQYANVAVGAVNVKQDVRPGESPPAPPPPVSPPAVPPVSPPALPTSPGGSIAVTVWNDLNADGRRQKREPGLASLRVVLDVGNDGQTQDEPHAITGEDGLATFTALDQVAYSVHLDDTTGWRVTSLGGTSRGATVESRRIKAKPCGLTQAVTIGGQVFADGNVNAVQDDDEPPFRKARVFLDLNGDGVRQKEERIAKIAPTGAYRFTGLPAGQYSVRLLFKPGFVPAAPAVLSVDVSTTGVESLLNNFGV